MKSVEANLKFPVVGFTPDRAAWGFADLDTLTACGSWTLKDDLQRGMELVDSDGRRWVVRSVRKTGRARPLLPWLVMSVLSGPLWRIDQEMDELEPISFAEVKDRVCAAIEANAEDYQDCCADPEHEHEDGVESRIAQVRASKTVAQIIDKLGLDSFMSY